VGRRVRLFGQRDRSATMFPLTRFLGDIAHGASWVAHAIRMTLCRVHSRFVAHTCLVAVLALPSPSGAEVAIATHPIDIQWQAPPECPDVNSVRLSTERLLGKDLTAPQRQRVAARATVSKNHAGNWELRLSLVVDDRAAEVDFAAKECRVLADATALHVALAADPVAVVESMEPAPPPSFEAKGEAERPPSDQRDHSADAGRALQPSTLQVGLRAMSGAGFGPLPGVAPGVAILGSVQVRSFRAEFGGQGFCCSEARYTSVPDVGGRFQLFSGVLRGCTMSSGAGLTFPVCVGALFGFARGEGFGTAETGSARSAWGAIVLGPALRMPIGGRVALWVEGDGFISFVRPGFRVRNLEALYVAPSGGAQAWAGVEVDLER
jgi:hypothetical protein